MTLVYEGLAEKLSGISGSTITQDQIMEFARPHDARYRIELVNSPLLVGTSRTYSGNVFGATFELHLPEEILRVEIINSDHTMTPEEVVRRTLSGLIYLYEHFNSGAVARDDKPYRLFLNII